MTNPRHPVLDPVTRRAFLRNVFLTGTAAATPSFLAACGSGGAEPNTGSAGTVGGGGSVVDGGNGNVAELSIPVGPLADIGDLQAADANGVMLPPGFTSRVVARAGANPVTGMPGLGFNWHRFPDGGATYVRDNGGWIYTSNSEVLGVDLGGASALVFDPDGTVVDAYTILSGTAMNCAGGKTPWNTWISCEETAAGECWETDPFGVEDAVAKPALGLFAHEAYAVDMADRTSYLTQDSGSGRFYRFVSDASDVVDGGSRLNLEAGSLQVMNIEGLEDGVSTSAMPSESLRQLMRVTWKAVPSNADNGGFGTIFDGGEGLWFYTLPDNARSRPPGGDNLTDRLVFFTTKGDNRVWAFDVANQLIELIFDNDQIDPDFNQVDNLTVSQAGDILVAEDGSAVRIMVVVPNQPAKTLMQLDETHSASEVVGPAFSPDGSRLYFSSQRGPDALMGSTGTTFEVTIPPAFRPTAAQIEAARAG